MLAISSALAALTSHTLSIELTVDATDAALGVYRVTERLDARSKLSLPEYIPGKHSPQGRISEVTALRFAADGRPINWRRDSKDPWTFHLSLPSKAKSVVASYKVLRALGSPFHARIPWDAFILLPTRADTDGLRVRGHLRAPAGWTIASALKATGSSQGTTSFQAVSATEFIDSPVQIGKFTKKYDLGVLFGAPVDLAIAGNNNESIQFSQATIAGLRQLVAQAGKMFGGRHFRRYTFLVVADGADATEGLEHHESSENTVAADDPLKHPENLAILLGHEFSHSWNGKYRRPTGLNTKNYSEPMQTELLWVYEGLTEYLGLVLAGRCGLVDFSSFKDTLAAYATAVRANRGRSWRSLADTTRGMKALDDKIVWKAESRSYADYYDEGALLWLEVDTILRSRSGGTKSLDDFLKKFAGGLSGPMVKPYSLEGLVSTLRSVLRYDWSTFFRRRVYEVRNDNAMSGVSMAGYRYVLSETPSARAWTHLAYFDDAALLAHWGASVKDDGTIDDVILDSLAFRGSLAPGQKIVELDGKAFEKAALLQLAANQERRAVTLEIDQGGFKLTKNVSLGGGPFQPHLERVASKADLLVKIATPR